MIGEYDMNLHALRIFTQVANLNSVTRSAESLLISQPAVTAQLRKLEQEIGMKLVIPKGRSIQLTEAGLLLANHSNRLFGMETEIEKVLKDFSDGNRGSLRICATQLPAGTVLPSWIVKFKDKYPLVDVELFKGNSETTYQSLLDYSVHIAFVCNERHEKGVESLTLLEDELIFIVPKNHKLAGKEVTFEELIMEPFILREEGSATRNKLLSLCETLDINKPQKSIQIEGLRECIETVKAGYGVSLVSALAVKNELHNDDIGKVDVKNVYISHPIKLCRRINEDPLSITNKFIAVIQDELKNT